MHVSLVHNARVFLPQHALRMRQSRAHGFSNPYVAGVITNQCPWCKGIYSTKQQARVHVRLRQHLGRCP
eukprot:4044120-Heterocapsa_arctica.AAC.1